jgi:putative membrane protein insertion efficiency factor
MKKILIGLIKTYSYLISPLTGPNCRFYPTCSAYMAEAIEHHGCAKGVVLGTKRLCKCHPLYKGAMLDPVPASIDWGGVLGYKRGTSSCLQPTIENERKN